MQQKKPAPRTMKAVTDQYRDADVIISSGHQPHLELVPVPHYTDEEHETWAIMFKRQMEALPSRATEEFLDALEVLKLPADRIPRLKDVSKALEKSTGWKITRVEGLVPEKEFFECLSQKLFPCTDFIRERKELEYTPSPDMFHDIFGHLPLITNSTFAEFYEFFGKTALKARAEQITQLQRIYWFSVEFGLIQKPSGLRIYGSGILSSPEEVLYSVSGKPNLLPWDFEAVANKYFEIHHLQEDLYVIDSFKSLLSGFKAYAKRHQLA